MRLSAFNLARVICASLLPGVMMSALPVPSAAQTQVRDWEVPFFTLRDRTDSDDPGDLYGSERSDLKAGWCRVRELDLSVLSSLADSAPSFMREEFLRLEHVRDSDSTVVLGVPKTIDGDIQDWETVISDGTNNDYPRPRRVYRDGALAGVTVNVLAIGQDDERFEGHMSIAALRLRSIACVPMRARGKPLGHFEEVDRVVVLGPQGC